MKKIKLSLGKRYEIEDTANREFETYEQLLNGTPTLKDLAIIMDCCIGDGVFWNLSDELSKRTGFDFITIDNTLHEIVREYCELTDEIAYQKFSGARLNPRH